MFATKSCAEIDLRMGRGVVYLGSSVMASAPDLSAGHPSNPICRATSSWDYRTLEIDS